MSYNQPTYNNFNDARRAPPRQEQDPRYNGQGARQNPVGSRPVYQQAPVGYAPSTAHIPAPGLGAPLSLPQPAPMSNMAYGGAHTNLQFPPHPDTKPRSVPQNNMPVYQPSHYQPRMNIQELVQVPPELAAFASDPQFQTILLKVKEQTMINFISLNRSPAAPDSVESISIDAPSRESAQLARGLIETHFKLQAKLKHAETRLQKVQTDLFSAQGEIASGMMIEFSIDPELVGLALGKKGARIKQIEQDTKVTSINVTGETGRIMVVGPDSQSVQRARELLELQEECIPLESHQIEWLSNKFNSGFLHDIKSGSDLIVTRVNSEKFTLDIVGTVQAVRSARFMLSTQLEYVEKQIEIEASERAAREKLQQVRKQYGMAGGRYDYENRNDRGDRGDRSDRDRSDRDRSSNSNNNHNNRDRTTNNSDRGDRQGDRQQTNGARSSAPSNNAQTNVAGNNNRGSRSNGQDSLVNLQSNKKAGPSAQAVADAVGNAYKKPSSAAAAAAAAAAPAATVGDSKTSSRGQTSAQSASNSKTDKKDTAPVPMLQQVTQNPRGQNKKKESTAAATTSIATPQQGKRNQSKNDVEAVTEGVKNLKVDNTQKTEKKNANKTEKVDVKPAATDAAPAKTATNNDKRRNNAKAAEPAPAATVGRVVEYEEAPLPKRQNNRNKKAIDSLATVGAASAAAADAFTAAVSTGESAAETEGESKRRRPAGNKKAKNDTAAAAAAADATTSAKDSAKDAAAKEPKTAMPTKSAKNSDSAKEGKVEKATTAIPPGLPSPATASKGTSEVVPAAPVSASGPPAIPVAVAVVSADHA